MGASESKLAFKQGIFRLAGPDQIKADDPYWTNFWQLPESTEDVFSLFSPADIRRARDQCLPNIETLVLAVTSRLFALRNSRRFPSPDAAPEQEALNCVRVLTRLLPFLYEAENLAPWEEKFFWARRRKRVGRRDEQEDEVLFDESADTKDQPPAPAKFEDAKPLGEELVDTLVDLLFFTKFTVPESSTPGAKVSYAIWQSGVGCNTSIVTTKEFENNRIEVLRLLLVLASRSMYSSANTLPVNGVHALTYLTTCSDKQIVLSLLCSLLNTTMKYNPATWRVPYDHVIFGDTKQVLITYCLQLLLILLVYPPPQSDNAAPKNFFRHFFGRLHRPQDFQFLVGGMTRILNQPLQSTFSMLPGNAMARPWAPEMLMLYWEALQCNKRFRAFITDTDRAKDFTVLVLFYALESKNDPNKHGLTRMCIFILQTMSSEANFGKSLNTVFEAQETLPTSIRIPNFHGTYGDFIVFSIYTLITSGRGKLDTVYPALLAILNNIAPHLEGLGRAASSKLIQLFTSMSSPSFLLANESNHALLQALLEAFNAIIEHHCRQNPHFIYAVLRTSKRFQALRRFTLEGGQEELERQAKQRKEQMVDGGGSTASTRDNSIDSARGPLTVRTSHLGNVPEESSTFVIGDDDEDEDDEHLRSASRSPTGDVQAMPSGSRATPVASPTEDNSMPTQLRGMSEKARGKMPVGQSSFSRTNSNTSLGGFALGRSTSNMNGSGFEPTPEWFDTWLPTLPLHAILTVIDALGPKLGSVSTTRDMTTALRMIQESSIHGLDEQGPLKVHLFEWSPLSLGWYESLLWGFIFASEMQILKGTSGVWNGTAIKLFKVQEVASPSPSLLAPRGAVDAVGSNLVQRIGALNLRGGASGAPAAGGTGATGGAAQGNATGGNGRGGNATMTVRDV